MTDPKHAHETENGRYYEDPDGGPDLVSVTNVLGTSVAKPVLQPWAVKLTVEWALERLDEIVERADTDRAALIRQWKAVHKDVSEAAKDLGTRVHDRGQAEVLGTPFAADPEVEPFARQLLAWFTEWGVDFERDVVATEITCIHRRLGYAGTADLIIWLPTGPGGRRELWLIDYKTSTTRPAKSAYPENAQQLAALRFCEGVLLPDDSTAPMPEIERTGVLNLRPKSRALLDMPADRDAHRAFRGALANATWHHDAPRSFPLVLPPVAAAPAGPTLAKAA
jgi:hypothetical protein